MYSRLTTDQLEFFFPNGYFSIPDVCIERLQEEFKQLDCTDTQKNRMEEFFNSKRAVGELKQDDLVNILDASKLFNKG